MMALVLSEDRLSMAERRRQIIDGLHALPGQIQTDLQLDKGLQDLSRSTLKNQRSLLILGRGLQ